MKRLIVSTTVPGLGCLKSSGIADVAIGTGYSLMSGPVPVSNNPLDLFAKRAELFSGDTEDFEIEAATTGGFMLAEFLREAKACDRVELWMDPDPNSQLQLMQFLDLASSYPELMEKLVIGEMDRPLGRRHSKELMVWQPTITSPGTAEMSLAQAAWRAFQRPTPKAWFALLQRDDLDVFPLLTKTILRALEELPDEKTGLSKTQHIILTFVKRGDDNPLRLLGELDDARDTVFDYWPHGKIIDKLASCKKPAITGLNESPFTQAMHHDPEKRGRYAASRLKLTDLGREILAGNADFAEYNEIDRWWGGTRLTSENLWRWNAEAEKLVAQT